MPYRTFSGLKRNREHEEIFVDSRDLLNWTHREYLRSTLTFQKFPETDTQWTVCGRSFHGSLTTAPIYTLAIPLHGQLEVHEPPPLTHPVVVLRSANGAAPWFRLLVPERQRTDGTLDQPPKRGEGGCRRKALSNLARIALDFGDLWRANACSTPLMDATEFHIKLSKHAAVARAEFEFQTALQSFVREGLQARTHIIHLAFHDGAKR